MELEERAAAKEKLLEQVDDLLAIWLPEACAHCVPPLKPETVTEPMAVLVAQMIEILLGEPFRPKQGRGLAVSLIGHFCRDPALWECTHRAFSQHLLQTLPQAQQLALYPHLSELLGEMAVGFMDVLYDEVQRNSEQNRDDAVHLRGENDFLTTLLDTVHAIILVGDMQGRIVLFNRHAEQVSGYSFDEVKGKPWQTLVPAQGHPRAAEAAALTRELRPDSGPILVNHENLWKTRNGELRNILWSISGLFDADGKMTHGVSIGLDITAQRRLEAELDAARRRLARVREEERLRLAQHLHDNAVQQLLGLSYELAGMQERALDDSRWSAEQRLEEVIPGLKLMRQELVTVANELRQLLGKLRPPGLRELGLREALEAYVVSREWQRGSAPPEILLKLPSEGTRELSEAQATCLFQVAQEAMWNARKHASASTVVVSLDVGEEQAQLTIRDDGTGFKVPQHLYQFATSDHFGILWTQERVEAQGGKLDIRSEPGGGTEVRATLPLQKEDDRPARRSASSRLLEVNSG